MKTRVISGAVLAVIGVAAIFAGGWVLTAVLLFCSLVGMDELEKAAGIYSKESGRSVPVIVGIVGTICYYLTILKFGNAAAFPAAGMVMILILMSYVLSYPKIPSQTAMLTGFSFFYIAVMLSFILLIRQEPKGLVFVWLVFLSSWIADTCAYFAGMKYGKHKMSPVLSPKKTVEGAIGGVLGSAAAAFLFSLVTEGGKHCLQFALICAVGAVISIFGDLTASAIKREHGIKDYGSLIPGHGGIMDRFDSVLFTAPGVYFLTILLIGKM